MGRVVVVEFVSLDGVVQSPLSPEEDRDGGFDRGGWVLPYADEVMAGVMRELTTRAAGMLLGRRSHDILRAAWAGADRSEPAVAAMNDMPKYVLTRGGRDLGWAPSQEVDGDALAALRERVVGDLVVFGSGQVVRELAARDLVDSYRLLQFPVVLGPGKRLFGPDAAPAVFVLTDVARTPSGIAIMVWDRARP